MPKIKKETIVHIKNYDTLKIFQFDNSKKYYVSFYVGKSHLHKSGNIEKSTKQSNQREAIKVAKQIYDEFRVEKKDEIVNKDYNLDKDIVESYFYSREKLYLMRNRNIANMTKEKNQYYNYCSPFFTNINYNDEIEVENAISDLVNHLRQTRKDTTINKYMNILNQIFKHAQKKGVMKSIPDVPTFARINEEVPPYFPKDLRMIRNRLMQLYKETEDKIYTLVYDYIGFLSGLKINRAGLNALNVKQYQFTETKDHTLNLPIVKVQLFKTKNNPKVADVCEPWFVEQYYNRLKTSNQDAYFFAPEIKDRNKLYEKVRKTFVRVSSELKLYTLNGKTRPLYSIRHMNALILYEQLSDIELVAQALNTTKEIVNSNYLNHSDQWAKNRFKILGYDKKKYQLTNKN